MIETRFTETWQFRVLAFSGEMRYCQCWKQSPFPSPALSGAGSMGRFYLSASRPPNGTSQIIRSGNRAQDDCCLLL